jgi:hypothetical protein
MTKYARLKGFIESFSIINGVILRCVGTRGSSSVYTIATYEGLLKLKQIGGRDYCDHNPDTWFNIEEITL